MSIEYDIYLAQHKANVKKGFDWLSENIPELVNCEMFDCGMFDLENQTISIHDNSKSESDEYDAYDAYFYGGNK